jgi:hypothetical protein
MIFSRLRLHLDLAAAERQRYFPEVHSWIAQELGAWL